MFFGAGGKIVVVDGVDRAGGGEVSAAVAFS